MTRTIKKKITYITGTRADFGLMTPVLRAIQKSKKLELQIIATGMHLIGSFGHTIEEVRKEFPGKVTEFETDIDSSPEGATKFIADVIKRLMPILKRQKPDLLLLLGDRPEMLATAICGSYLGIPVAHVHGGDKTLTDDSTRHAITKLSHLHFAATKNSAKRIKKLGEESWRIHTVGAPSLDAILGEKLPETYEIFKKRHLKLKKGQKFILLLQHPESHTWTEAKTQMKTILKAVSSFKLPVIVIYPNADPGRNGIIDAIHDEQTSNNGELIAFANLPYREFLVLERETAVWVGNSSAAIIESASFHVPVVNIGSREKGREKGQNVIDVPCEERPIKQAVRKALFDKKFHDKVRQTKNIWGDGKTSGRIVKILENLQIDEKLLTKQITY